MLGMKTYTKEFIQACRARVDADLKAYRAQVGKTPSKEFEARFFNGQVQLLDHMFVHRLATVEGKDGNPLNEVRVLCNSLLLNKGKMVVEKQPGWPTSAGGAIKWSQEKSVLKIPVGQEIALTEADFLALSKAFFAELEKKYL